MEEVRLILQADRHAAPVLGLCVEAKLRASEVGAHTENRPVDRASTRGVALVANDTGLSREGLFRGGGDVFPGLRPRGARLRRSRRRSLCRSIRAPCPSSSWPGTRSSGCGESRREVHGPRVEQRWRSSTNKYIFINKIGGHGARSTGTVCHVVRLCAPVTRIWCARPWCSMRDDVPTNAAGRLRKRHCCTRATKSFPMTIVIFPLSAVNCAVSIAPASSRSAAVPGDRGGASVSLPDAPVSRR